MYVAHDSGGTARRDLLNGRRTLPIAHALTVLDGDRRGRLLRQLALARLSAEHHDGVRTLLEATGSARYADFMVRLHKEKAREHLAAASPREAAGRELEMMLDRLSIRPQAEGAPT